jgi:hypothetical protein
MGVTVLIGIFVFSRMIPHPPNFTALGAVLVWASAFIGSRTWALLALLLGLLGTDLIFGFYPQMIWLYLTLAALMAVGFVIRPATSPLKLISFALLQSFVFYLTTNFAVWATSPWYSKDLTGLLQSYVLALPFYGNQVLGDLVYLPLVGLAYYFTRSTFTRSTLSSSLGLGHQK